jgi:hypothetical protein
VLASQYDGKRLNSTSGLVYKQNGSFSSEQADNAADDSGTADVFVY